MSRISPATQPSFSCSVLTGVSIGLATLVPGGSCIASRSPLVLWSNGDTSSPTLERMSVPRTLEPPPFPNRVTARSEENTSELKSLMRHSYAVLCLKKKMYRYNKQYDLNC